MKEKKKTDKKELEPNINDADLKEVKDTGEFEENREKMKAEVAIDNDFVMHLAEIDWSLEELEKIIYIFFDELKVVPVMHELVYKYELVGGADTSIKTIALGFFEHGIMKQKMFEEYLKTPEKKQYYEMVLKQIYHDFKGDFPESVKDVFTEWKSRSSLGETHSITMCLVNQMDIILSDDNDSRYLRNIIEDKFAFSLKVYDREEACNHLKEIGTTLNKDIRNIIKHKKTNRKR